MAAAIRRVAQEARNAILDQSPDDFLRVNTQKFRRPANNAHEKDYYYFAGVMIALSIVHGGPAPHFFSPVFVRALEVGPANAHPTLEDMRAKDLKTLLEKLLMAKSVGSFQKALEKLTPFLIVFGIEYHNCKTSEDAQEIVKKIIHYYLFDRTSLAFERFTAGLKTLGVYANIKSLKNLFLFKDPKLDKEGFESLFSYDVSEKGSNRYQKETAIIALWRDFLEEAEDEDFGITIPEILMFTTGLKNVPPLGFSPKPSIEFVQGKYPKAKTCLNILYLPCLSADYSEFSENMKFGILNTQGFHD